MPILMIKAGYFQSTGLTFPGSSLVVLPVVTISFLFAMPLLFVANVVVGAVITGVRIGPGVGVVSGVGVFIGVDVVIGACVVIGAGVVVSTERKLKIIKNVENYAWCR